MPLNRKDRALSLVDLLIAIAVIGLLCSVAVPAFSRSSDDVLNARLQSDVDTINRAIRAYQANGGDLRDLRNPNAVLARIKSHEFESKGVVQFLGSTDQMIDPRLSAMIQTRSEMTSDRLRAIWDPVSQQFIITNLGRGVGAFVIQNEFARR